MAGFQVTLNGRFWVTPEETVIAVAGTLLPSDVCYVLDSLAARIQRFAQDSENMTDVQKAEVEATLFQEAYNPIGFYAKRDVGEC